MTEDTEERIEKLHERNLERAQSTGTRLIRDETSQDDQLDRIEEKLDRLLEVIEDGE